MGPDCNSRHQRLTNPFGIYIHIPFCVHKCGYCDFYSFTDYRERDFERYTEAICKEIVIQAQWLKREWGFETAVGSVFFGGGTPSLLPVALLGRIIEGLRTSFKFEDEVEITLEANPETVSEAFAEALRSLVVNRVSLGAQSFQSQNLKLLERLSSVETIELAVNRLIRAGFDNLSLDLIFGMTHNEWEREKADIDAALRLGPSHLSRYSLTLGKAHPLRRHVGGESAVATSYEKGVAYLESKGFEQYEISNFALPGRRCRHNELYWAGGDFLGLGASAASRFFREGGFWHTKRPAHFEEYLCTVSGPPQFEKTDESQTRLEAAFLELRQIDGVALDRFQARYRHNLRDAPKFSLFLEEGLIGVSEERLWLTKRGRLLADSVTEALSDTSEC